MAFVAQPNIIQMEWRYTLNGQECENRLNIDNLTTISEANLTAFATGAWDWWDTSYSPFITERCTLREVVATDMGEQNGAQIHYAPSTTLTGTVVGAAYPNETSFCVTLSTQSRGRSARGRWFVAGIPTASRQDDNNITAAYAEGYRGALQTYINAISAATRLVVIVSLRSNNAPRPGGPVYFPVSSAVVKDTLFDSQKKRKPGVGV